MDRNGLELYETNTGRWDTLVDMDINWAQGLACMLHDSLTIIPLQIFQ